jgi:hypothetical protein
MHRIPLFAFMLVSPLAFASPYTPYTLIDRCIGPCPSATRRIPTAAELAGLNMDAFAAFFGWGEDRPSIAWSVTDSNREGWIIGVNSGDGWDGSFIFRAGKIYCCNYDGLMLWDINDAGDVIGGNYYTPEGDFGNVYDDPTSVPQFDWWSVKNFDTDEYWRYNSLALYALGDHGRIMTDIGELVPQLHTRNRPPSDDGPRQPSSVVPEPGTLALAGVALLVAGLGRRCHGPTVRQ